jgi:Domain of unknown function (DUF4868)
MATLGELQAYDLAGADVSVWVFKTSANDGHPKFNGHWVGITEDLTAGLRAAVRSNLERITETLEYGILAQNNEGSCLTIMSDETYIHLIVAQVANETQVHKVRSVKDLANSKFCVAKFVHDGKTLLAVRKTDSTWSTRRASSLVKMVYVDDELDVDNKPTFAIRPDFDFFVLDDRVFIRSKPNFESVLAYKAGHEAAFKTLKAEAEFAGIFADLRPLTTYVGSNKIHLRRAVAIQQKGHYKGPNFMNRLRAEHKNMNLAIVFDENGLIVPTVESGSDIFRALLDHRLNSRLTSLMYDVQNTEQVG